MNIEDRADLAWCGMDNIHDMDTSLTDYAKAAAQALGWIDISKKVPDFDDVVVCTNGRARWLDSRTLYSPEMRWNGHAPTHWHPLADLPAFLHEDKNGAAR